MKNFIFTGWQLFPLIIIIVILMSVEMFAGLIIDDSTKVADNVSCTVKDVGVNSGMIELKLDCDNGKKTTTTYADVVASYMKNPGVLTCALYKNNSVRCNLRSDEG